MTRAKSGGPRSRAKHKKMLKAAKGYRMTRHTTYRRAHESILHSGVYAFAGRRLRRRDLRRLWIQRINAGLTQYGVKYSRFIKALNDAKVELDRKMLAELVVKEPKIFAAVVEKVSQKES